jgi:hypothetical protein
VSDERDEQNMRLMRQRLRGVLNSDRAVLTPTELSLLQKRIADALSDLMILDEGMDLRIERDQGQRVLRLTLPVKAFLTEAEGEKRG